jgi:hypothetical protein
MVYAFYCFSQIGSGAMMISKAVLNPTRYPVASKVIEAIAGVLIMEMVDRGLDSVGLSEEKSRITRAMIKGMTSVASGVLVDSLLRLSRDAAEEASAPASSKTVTMDAQG